ncbi:MAG: hypothetical protein ACPGSD_14890 [Flavobacteriales bacterium]
MGFNIAGVVINKNFESEISSLGKHINKNIKEFTEIDFEDAVSEYEHLGIIDVLFSEKGTMLIMNLDLCLNYYHMNDLETFAFSIDESSNSFAYHWSFNGNEVGDGWSYPQMIMEYKSSDNFDLGAHEKKITDFISERLIDLFGKDIYNIDPGIKVKRFKVV